MNVPAVVMPVAIPVNAQAALVQMGDRCSKGRAITIAELLPGALQGRADAR